MPQERSIVICGLPESGKTTFLAALWHLVTARDLPTTLTFESLRDGDSSYLNEIASRWRSAKVQERTNLGPPTVVSMNLLDKAGTPLRLTFPDLSGESYRRMWEERECDRDVAAILKGRTGVLLFVHADRIQPPQWVVDLASLSRRLGLPVEPGKPIPWHARFAPTQVQVVELLQFLRAAPLGVGPRRLAIVLSAWDKVAPEGRTPSVLLAERMPLLHQYLRSMENEQPWRVFGVSAQGGDYEPLPGAPTTWSPERVEALRQLDQPSRRIQLVQEAAVSHDLTEPVAWLTS
jgi:hypothetical protein